MNNVFAVSLERLLGGEIWLQRCMVRGTWAGDGPGLGEKCECSQSGEGWRSGSLPWTEGLCSGGVLYSESVTKPFRWTCSLELDM